MDKAQLLGTLNDLVARYETHRGFIDRARAQLASGKFASNVIDKVVKDHSEKAASVAEQVQPLVPELNGLMGALRAEKAGILDTKGGLDEEVQEFELRLAIGELNEADFEQAAGALRDRLNTANARIGVVDSELEELSGAFEKWNAVAQGAGHAVVAEAAKAETPKPEPVKAPPVEVAKPEPAKELTKAEKRKAKEEAVVVVPEPVAAPEPEPELEAVGEDTPVEAIGAAAAIEIDVDFGSPGESLPEPVGPHTSRTDIKDDISAIFGGDAQNRGSADEDIAIETSEIVEEAGDGPSADVQFGFGDEVLGSPPEVEPEIAADEPRQADHRQEQSRKALLLYQEGTADEQIYPFTNDTLTIGRGRENDIQIKADSKVSRYHCKLFRRGNNFYIEDVKSSNGTLVNGDLITDRRLFGGEEVIIGETFFRFRIMD